jgi:hypothetical protein
MTMFDARTVQRSFPDRRHRAERDALAARVYGEFSEMPCLRLTNAQARRLFGLRSDACQRILADLAARGSLIFEAGQYRLNDSRASPRTGGLGPTVERFRAS